MNNSELNLSVFKKQALLFLFVLLYIPVPVFAQRNVILIIADDLGTDYLGFYENHVDTIGMPNIRKLLSRGVRFTKAWSNPLCSPTRAGILTGRYSFRTGVGTAIKFGTSQLNTWEVTIPRLLNIFKPSGIAKANIGKWHLHQNTPANYYFPNLMGYDHFEGPFSGAINSYTNWTKVTNGIASNVTNYATTEITDNAINWIKANSYKPFFLWLAYNAPHTPYHLPPNGLYTDTTLTGTSTDINANPRKYFKAMVEALDHEIGRLFDTLQFIQKWDSTDIIFIGDNGDDQRVVQSTGNGKAKGSLYQAGISVPLIISGPSVVNSGRISDALVNTHDLFATILELMGNTDWHQQIPQSVYTDSKSILPVIKNTAAEIRPWVFSEVFGATSTGDGKTMRNMNYKLIDFDSGGQKFYYLAGDVAEMHDLLIDTLTAGDSAAYIFLCNEMTGLTGVKRFCTLFGYESDPSETLHFPSSVYPNPFKNYINVFPCNNYVYTVTDLLGQKIYSGTVINEKDFSFLKKGIYFLKITGESNSVFKLLKE